VPIRGRNKSFRKEAIRVNPCSSVDNKASIRKLICVNSLNSNKKKKSIKNRKQKNLPEYQTMLAIFFVSLMKQKCHE